MDRTTYDLLAEAAATLRCISSDAVCDVDIPPLLAGIEAKLASTTAVTDDIGQTAREPAAAPGQRSPMPEWLTYKLPGVRP